MGFKDSYQDMQELARELDLLRRHNKQFKPGDPQQTLLMFAEGALVLVCLERFVRIVLGTEAGENDTLHTLLEKATGKRLALLTLPFDDQQDGIKKICAVRNTILHGNYEQAAKQASCASVPEYFKTQFAGELESMFKILDHLMQQIDPETGRRYAS